MTTPSPTAPLAPPAITAWRGAYTNDFYTKVVDPRVRWYLNFKDKSLDLTFKTNITGERSSRFLIQISFKTCLLIIQEFLSKIGLDNPLWK